jgi:hypothetical protein
MRKVTGRILAAMVAVLAFGAIMASTAAAASHPLFLTASKKTLLFSGESNKPVLRGVEAGVKAKVECEKVLVHGFILNESSLAHLKPIIFHKNCLQKIGNGGNEVCNEPIETKTVLAELGLTTSTNKIVALLLASDDGKTEFAKFTCGGHETKVGGTIVGEIPPNDGNGRGQYNVERENLLVVFATNPVESEKQAINKIFLLGTEMNNQELKIEGFLGGPASEEVPSIILKSDGNVKLDVK